MESYELATKMMLILCLGAIMFPLVSAENFGYTIKDAPASTNLSRTSVNDTVYFQGYTPTTLRDWMQTTFDTLYCALTGCSMTGDLETTGDITANLFHGEFNITRNHTYTICKEGSCDYESTQTALNAHKEVGALFLVYPGTYTDTINFTANRQVVKGMGYGNNVIIQQADANVVDFGTHTGCRLSNFKLYITAATGAVNVVRASAGGKGVVTDSKITLTTSGDIAGTQPALINGDGFITVKRGEYEYFNNANAAGQIKAAFSPGAGGVLDIKRPCCLNITNSGTALATTIFYSTTTGVVSLADIFSADVHDEDASIVAGLGYIGAGAGEDEFYRNTIHVTGGATNDVYGIFHAGTGELRSMFNHIHSIDGGGDAYGFNVGAGAKLTSQFDDIIAVDGNVVTGTLINLNSVEDGNLTVSDTVDTQTIYIGIGGICNNGSDSWYVLNRTSAIEDDEWCT